MLYTVNEFAAPNAVTPDLYRIELHLAQVSQLGGLHFWPRLEPDVGAMLIKDVPIKDVDGQLERVLRAWAVGPAWTPSAPQQIYDQILNWLVFASAVWASGEHLRAAELLTWVRGGLLRLARLRCGAPHFPAAARLAEKDPGEWPPQIAEVQGEVGWALALAVTLCRRLAAELRLDSREALIQRVVTAQQAHS